jgi:serine/threonine-protein phosphatase PP1 catalytic subunit
VYIFKILFRQRVFLLRGNHECESISTADGFKRECVQYLSEDIYRGFIGSFHHLPFAAVLNSRTFCVHAGISPLLLNPQNISDVVKPSHRSENRLNQDLVWSDPLSTLDGFEHSGRRFEFLFNDESLDTFLEVNGLSLTYRSHEPHRDGFDKPLKNCITVFSCTNYRGMDTSAAVSLLAEDNGYEIHIFKAIMKGSRTRPRVIVPDWFLRTAGVAVEDGEDLAEKLGQVALSDENRTVRVNRTIDC